MTATSQKEFNRAYYVRGACDGLFTVTEVAERLHLSARRVKYLKAAYRKVGDTAFVHGNKGRVPKNKVPDAIRKKIVDLKASEPYTRANFAHFTEILQEQGISYDYTTVRNILTSAGIKIPKCRRPKKEKVPHPPRPRREAFGEMLQADASPFDWLGNGEMYALHGYIDDATGKITGLYMEKNECLLGYLEVTRQTIENFGVPLELYPDKAGIFFVNNKKDKDLTVEEQLEGLKLKDQKTQLGRIMGELDVDMHPAHSPQAKGRIERLWETLQSRLPVEFKLHGITTIEAANNFLPLYTRQFNTQFGVQPAQNKIGFVKLYDLSTLDTLLTVKIERSTDRSGVFSFHKHKFMVTDRACMGKKIEIVMSEKIGMKAMARGDNTLYEIKSCDFNNKQIKTHMPNVIKMFIDKYLLTNAKETTKTDGDIFVKKIEAWQ
jgi:transposase